MNIEITDLDMILNYLETTSLEPHDDYSSEFTYKDQKILYKYIKQLQQENKHQKDKLSKIETLIINHNCDTGDIYYRYNNKFLKSELKQRILEILYGESSDSNE